MKKIAVFGHVGRGNLGDEATVAAILQNIRLRQPNAEISTFTMDPVDSRERHQVPAFPIRRLAKQRQPAVSPPQNDMSQLRGIGDRLKHWLKSVPVVGTVLRRLRAVVDRISAAVAELPFLVKSSRRLKGTDLLIVAGGGQLGDYFEGSWGYPFTILKWTLMAKARGAKVAFLSVGAGPIDSFLSKRFIRWSLNLASYRSFRDESSRSLIESLGVSGENHVVPDLVHGLQPPELASGGSSAAPVIGINPLPFHDSRYWAEDSPDVYQRYVQTLASFALWLINTGRRVHLFPTQMKADPPVIKDVEAQIRKSLPSCSPDSLMCPHVRSCDDLLSAIAKTDLVVASRFHGIILSFSMGKPVIGLSYYRKTDELMADMGLGDYVMDIGRFDVPWLTSRFEQLMTNSEQVRSRIAARRAEYRSTIDNQYDRLFGRLAGAAAAELDDRRPLPASPGIAAAGAA